MLMVQNLYEFLSNNIINITEISQSIGQIFKTNVNIEGYNLFSTETKSLKGGSAINVKEHYDTFERDDLKICNEIFESVWIEIKNKNSKIVVCGCIYRHPRYDMKDSLNYMDKCLKSLFKENKEIYSAGDFNTDFLKIESNQSYLEFYNLITSSGFLPQIIQPTRVTEYSSTVIDKIFANTFRSGTIIDNLLLSISEHHCQFVSIANNNVSLKKLNIYQRNYSKYNIRAFHL